jgi:hypothetical protein
LKKPDEKKVNLTLMADLELLPLATSFVERSAKIFGLGDGEALSLTLASEEIFAYLCKVAPGGEIRFQTSGCGYFVEEEIVFQSGQLNLSAFNITSRVSIDECGPDDETGLLIASRMVDRFQFRSDDDGFHIELTKEKAYPEASGRELPPIKPIETFFIATPDIEELKVFVHLARTIYPRQYMPMSFEFPGKVADMVSCGEYSVVVASDRDGNLGAGILWRWEGRRLVEFYGPFCFCKPQSAGMAETLVEYCLAQIVRGRAVGLITRHPTPELPVSYFELLGSMTFRTDDGSPVEAPAYYRHLEEDLGLRVWASRELEPFLKETYQRMFLARDVQLVVSEGESASESSVLSPEFDRTLAQVVLRPVWYGADCVQVLKDHVDSLLNDGMRHILFEMDLGHSRHSHFTNGLFETGFEPRLVLPYAGKGDLVIFQHREGVNR